MLGAVSVDGEALPAGKQLTLLTVLLCHANQPVTPDTLMEAAWPRAAPSPGTFRWHLHRLRAVVGDRLVHQAGGYLLAVQDGELDATRFDELVRRAAAEPPERALVLLEQALALWRGRSPYGGQCDPEVVRVDAARLEDARLRAVEARAHALMALGRSAECASELAAAVDAHPLRESLVELWLRALAGSGRRGEALQLYAETRRRLLEELGVEPGRSLRRLHEDLLRDDDAPRLLPPDVHAFTGRGAELEVLDRVLDGPPGLAVISGVGGVGKSGLALHWAHRVRDRFPDGQLYADLGEQAPEQVLYRFLYALGIVAVPDGLQARAALYRQVLARRKVLVVLDNATGSVQVEPLLPAAPGCVTVVTGRRRFERLVAGAGALPLALDTLPPADAALLISRVAGIDTDRAAPLAELCARLPLALRVAGARLVTRPGWTAETLTTRLAGAGRLDELRAGELDVRATLETSYHDLPGTERVLFERLGLLQVPTFTAWMAAALLEVPAAKGANLLERLAERQLLQPAGFDAAGQERYRFHDLVLLLARERAGTGAGQDTALNRFLACLLALARDAYLREYRGGFRLQHSDSPLWRPEDAVLPEDPMSWLSAEHATLPAAVDHAAVLGFTGLCWDLALTSVRLFEVQGRLPEWQQTSELALRACQEQGEEQGTTAMRASLGALAVFQRRHRDALPWLTKALPALDGSSFKALTLANLASAEFALGRPTSGHGHLTEARSLAAQMGDAITEALVLVSLAQRTPSDARPLLERAAELAAGHRRISLVVLAATAGSTLRQGRADDAEALSLRLLNSTRALGDRVYERQALCLRAEVLTALGRTGEAADCLRSAHALAQAQGVTELLKV